MVWSPRIRLGLAFVVTGMLSASSVAVAADLPEHDPLQILVISDGVNPHGLSDAELTQPGEVGAALRDPASGLNLDDSAGEPVVEVDSQCIDEALDRLAQPGAVDVVVYFAHVAATACDGAPAQAPLTAAFEEHLRAGGGIVVFHHGIYAAAGKEDVLQLLGGSASSISWDPVEGQDVIATAPEHFVAREGLDYPSARSFEGVGVAAGDYPSFNNAPDERYESMELRTEPAETRTILFASADAGGGSARVLGYDLHRPDWAGHVVFYQPGEHQPQALDLDGYNFQILANAVVYVGTTVEDAGEPPATTGDSAETDTAAGDESDPGGDDPSADETSGGTSEEPGATSRGEPGATSGLDAGLDGVGESQGQTSTAAGCSCRGGGPSGGAGLLLGALALLRRRRRAG